MTRPKFECVSTQCAGCPEIFTPTRGTQKYHTPECFRLHRKRAREEKREARPPIEKVCELASCGRDFTIDLQVTPRAAHQKYCSHACTRCASEEAATQRRRARLGLAEGERYVKGLADRTIEIINEVRKILDPESPRSVRSCCYHLLSIGLLSSTREFRNAQQHINSARIRDEGDNDLDDDCFVDRSRVLEYIEGYANADDFMNTVRNVYSRNHWTDQPVIPMILCEKDGFFFLNKVTDPLHVRLFLSKGTHGRSHLLKLAQHVADVINEGKRVEIGYVGDFDADGIGMERTAENGNSKTGTRKSEGLRQILKTVHFIASDTNQLTWKRIGLTEGQLLDLPVKARVAAKRTSKNFGWYKEEYSHLFTEELFTRAELEEAFGADHEDYDGFVFGGEADALLQEGMSTRVTMFIEDCTTNKRLWKTSVAKEKAEKKVLSKLTF